MLVGPFETKNQQNRKKMEEECCHATEDFYQKK